MSGGGAPPQDLNHAHDTHLDFATCGHTGFEAAGVAAGLLSPVYAPFTFSDLSDAKIWLPVAGFGDMSNLAISAAGAVCSGRDTAAGALLTGIRFGVVSRGRFFPDINGDLDLSVNFDQYIPGDDISFTRYFRAYMSLWLCDLNNTSQLAHGLMYGCMPNAGAPPKENAQLCSETAGPPYSNPALLKDLSGSVATVADNSTIAMRLKQGWLQLGAAIPRIYTHFAEVNLNAGAHVYGGVLADVDKKDFGLNGALLGERLFAGAFTQLISARFKARVISVTLNAGVYSPI